MSLGGGKSEVVVGDSLPPLTKKIPLREITFEMAQSLGLIPMPRNRYLTIDFPFESREAKLNREAIGEIGYRNDIGWLRRKYATVILDGEKLKVI